jgi:L-threonylcarbamoyladenylate synthase
MSRNDALDPDLRESVATAASAVRKGEAVVYPTETVYGLGANALSTTAVERVFEVKGRDRSKPLSLAAPSVDAALEYVHPTDREERFMRAFLPGPVTVVVERSHVVPDALTAGRDRVGVRVPDHPVALALLPEVAPLTATSANHSGSPSVTDPADLDPDFRDEVGAVIDAGTTAGTESTVVDPGAGVIHRRGALGDEVREWLASN